MCSSWSKPFVTSLTPGSLKQQYNGPKWKGNIWRYWTFDMYLMLQKWLNSSLPPLWSVAFFLSRSLFFFSTINFLLSQSRFWLPGYFFFSRQKRVGWSCCCWLHCAVKGGTDRHGGTARTGCQSFAAATSSVDVIPQPGVTHIIWLIYITPPRGTNIISHRAKAKPCGGGGERRERERAETKVWTARGLF